MIDNNTCKFPVAHANVHSIIDIVTPEYINQFIKYDNTTQKYKINLS